ncbi:MAG: hypothetical protein AVDCRST_MAG18-2511, partial [uncultured Thermomicrobiales bacterium]
GGRRDAGRHWRRTPGARFQRHRRREARGLSHQGGEPRHPRRGRARLPRSRRTPQHERAGSLPRPARHRPQCVRRRRDLRDRAARPLHRRAAGEAI